MASPSPTVASTPASPEHTQTQNQLQNRPQMPTRGRACVSCTRRKIKCDRADPCTCCRKSRIVCVYAAPQPRKRRKRAADDELLERIARYEELMRKNGVDFGAHVHTWVPSELEKNLPGGTHQTAQTEGLETNEADEEEDENDNNGDGSIVDDDGPLLAQEAPAPPIQQPPPPSRSPWHDLPHELKYPTVQTLRAPDDPLLHSTPSLQSIINEAATGKAPSLGSLHPQPRHIFVLWQHFVDRVNPLTKIVHTPTLQPRVLEASGDPEAAPPSLHALLFAIYTLSITSMSADECTAIFGESKVLLMTLYRMATLRALVAADFMLTRDMEVLQALVLFLFSDPESDLTHSLTGLAMRLGQRMGLNHADTNAKQTAFNQEMRVRLWWPLCGLAGRAGAGLVHGHASALKTALVELGDMRLPLNVNDADLHPDMAELPRERDAEDGPTEMLCVRMKFEFGSWVRSSPATTQTFESIVRAANTSGAKEEQTDAGMGTGTPLDANQKRIEAGAAAIRRIESVYEAKYLRHLDKRIPLHRLVDAMIHLAMARMRFTLYHPRHQRPQWLFVSTPEHGDIAFSSALSMLELVDVGLRSPFASHLFTYMAAPFQMDAYIYVLSDLRRRVSGERVAVAWRLIEEQYDVHPEMVEDMPKNTLFAALGDLALEAWAAREGALRAEQQVQGTTDAEVVVPPFIMALRNKKTSAIAAQVADTDVVGVGNDQLPAVPSSYAMPMPLDSVGDGDFGDVGPDPAWTFWEDLLWHASDSVARAPFSL